MIGPGFMQATFNAAVVVLLARPVGRYLARSYSGERTVLARGMGAIERPLLRQAGVSFPSGSTSPSLPEGAAMTWPGYLLSLLAFNGAIVVLLLVQQRTLELLQARSFGAGLCLFLSVLGRTMRGFASAATALTLLVALIRALRVRTWNTAGNFWVDLVRGTLYILLPLSVLLAGLLALQPTLNRLAASFGP